MKIYNPKESPMSVVVFFSGGASSLRAMLRDENYGKLYAVSGAFTDRKDAKDRELCAANGIDVEYIGRKKFYEESGLDPKNPDSRRHYYDAVHNQIARFNADVIALSGYMHIVSDPLLEEYQNRVFNVHPADLSILSGLEIERLDVSELMPAEVKKLVELNGLRRKLAGNNAVYDAVVIAGEPQTRSTIHIATADFDEGPIVVQSKPFEVAERESIGDIKKYARALQERMKVEGDGPAYIKALEFAARGSLAIEDGVVMIDGVALPYCGYRIR